VIPWEAQRAPDGRPPWNEDDARIINGERAAAWFQALAAGYDGSAALTASVEGTCMWRLRDNPDEYWLPQADRQTDINYTDEMVRRLAMPWLGGLLPQLYAGPAERQWLRRLAEEHRRAGETFLLWHLAGSAFHKIIPHAPAYIAGLLDQFPKLIVYLLGDARVASFADPARFPAEVRARVRRVAGQWTIRQQMLATSVAHCVVGPESSIVNAAACWDTPKVIFFSHSAPHNLSLYWWNAYPILPAPACECAPCYRLIVDEPAECAIYEDSPDVPFLGLQIEPPQPGAPRRLLGAKCCVHLDHGEVFRTIGSILNGAPDRTCPACGKRKSRILAEGEFICACGARYGEPRPPCRGPVPSQAMVCPICGAQAFDRVRAHARPGWARCGCGIVFQDVAHLDAAVYDEGYKAKYDAPELRAKIRAVGERWIPRMEELLGGPGRILEIGYCWPENLWLARERGWRIAGCEINKSAVSDFEVIEGDFEALDVGPYRGAFDAVISNHVFEHFHDPLKALEKMAALVRPGGLIVVETPDAENPNIGAHLHRKEHYVMWSPAALAREAMARGLEVVEVERHDGPDCGFISWYDFTILLRRPAAPDGSSAHQVVSASAREAALWHS
jgi:SAM-dependent methyltransferase